MAVGLEGEQMLRRLNSDAAFPTPMIDYAPLAEDGISCSAMLVSPQSAMRNIVSAAGSTRTQLVASFLYRRLLPQARKQRPVAKLRRNWAV